MLKNIFIELKESKNSAYKRCKLYISSQKIVSQEFINKNMTTPPIYHNDKKNDKTQATSRL